MQGEARLDLFGVALSGTSLINDLYTRYKEATKWKEVDKLVDRRWLSVAIAKGQLEGTVHDYFWSSEDRVATRELEGTHQRVTPFNKDEQVRYRICRGRLGALDVLMKRTA